MIKVYFKILIFVRLKALNLKWLTIPTGNESQIATRKIILLI